MTPGSRLILADHSRSRSSIARTWLLPLLVARRPQRLQSPGYRLGMDLHCSRKGVLREMACCLPLLRTQAIIKVQEKNVTSEVWLASPFLGPSRIWLAEVVDFSKLRPCFRELRDRSVKGYFTYSLHSPIAECSRKFYRELCWWQD